MDVVDGNRYEKFSRISSIIIFAILTVSTVRHILFQDFQNFHTTNDLFPYWVTFFINIIGIFISVYMFFFPKKIEFYGIMSFLYSINILLNDSSNEMGLVMYLLFIITLYVRGLLEKHKKLKLSLIALLFILLLFSEIRYGSEVFINSLFNKSGMLLVLLVSFYFLYQKHKESIPKFSTEKYLDLRNYPSLSKRDQEWVKLVLKETKYEVIATRYEVTSGTVRNVLGKIYKALGVGDRIGLMATYSNCTVICNQKEYEEFKKRKITKLEKQ